MAEKPKLCGKTSPYQIRSKWICMLPHGHSGPCQFERTEDEFGVYCPSKGIVDVLDRDKIERGKDDEGEP